MHHGEQPGKFHLYLNQVKERQERKKLNSNEVGMAICQQEKKTLSPEKQLED